MNEPIKCLQRILVAALIGTSQVLAPCAQALPEDAQQPIELDWNESDIGLDDGLMVLRGTDAEPASIRQGSMHITGSEIRIERAGELITRITTTGSPARFRQQLEAGQEPLQASGLTLVFDNASQILTIEEEAELIQAGTRTNAHHFEYNLATRRIKASRDPDGDQVRMVLQPPDQQAAPSGDRLQDQP
ncbi:MAG: lipopolysaccharide transport periplasmic protein LptA [Pseudohongiellaceae bacterium]